jgi:hypothetical protein
MKTPLPIFSLLLGTLTLAACRPDPLGPTGVQIDLITQDPRLYATSFQLLWMDQTTQLLDQRVPEQGTIDETQAPAVSVFIALTGDTTGMRRVLVRGLQGDKLVSEGAARLFPAPNYWSQIGIPMLAFGALADSDGDGLPDAVDNCPHERDPCGSGAVPPDAGATPDAEAPETTEPPDAAPIVDSPSVLPTGVDDAGSTDVRPS